MTVEEEPVSKVDFDNIADFKFMAAYGVYVKAFDEASKDEERSMLNNLISQLFNKEISYPRFYSQVNQYREDSDMGREFRRVRIKGQRKRAYRRDQQERERIRRHKR